MVNVNTKFLKTAGSVAAMVTVLAGGVNLRAATPVGSPMAGQNQLQTVAFKDSTEAGMLRHAYHILATGDHDYKGHRVKAMRQIESAAGLLGLDLKGDLKDKQPQALSDAKLREARGLLQSVLNSAEFKSEGNVAKHVNEAIAQINLALSIR